MFEKMKRLFTPAESMDAGRARSFMQEHKEGSYTLLDVRQPKEYEKEHIPGATLIPLGELSDSYDRLDRKKPIIVY
jgi:rhodanese-related sulfurtransferase